VVNSRCLAHIGLAAAAAKDVNESRNARVSKKFSWSRI